MHNVEDNSQLISISCIYSIISRPDAGSMSGRWMRGIASTDAQRVGRVEGRVSACCSLPFSSRLALRVSLVRVRRFDRLDVLLGGEVGIEDALGDVWASGV